MDATMSGLESLLGAGQLVAHPVGRTITLYSITQYLITKSVLDPWNSKIYTS
jgi:hypothetical protein